MARYWLAFVMGAISLFPSSPAGADDEYVAVLEVANFGDEVVIQRQNGDIWVLETGIGCHALSMMEGKFVIVQSGTLFGGIGSRLIIPANGSGCRVWNAERVR